MPPIALVPRMCSEEVEAKITSQVNSAEGRPLALRIVVRGDSAAHHELVRHTDHWSDMLRERILDRFDDRVWIERIKLRTRTDAKIGDKGLDSFANDLLAGLESLSNDFITDEIRDEIQRMPTRRANGPQDVGRND